MNIFYIISNLTQAKIVHLQMVVDKIFLYCSYRMLQTSFVGVLFNSKIGMRNNHFRGPSAMVLVLLPCVTISRGGLARVAKWRSPPGPH